MKQELTLSRAVNILNELVKLPHKIFWRRRLKSYFCHIICEFIFHTGIPLYELEKISIHVWRDRESHYNPRIRKIMDIYLKEIHIGGERLFTTPYSYEELSLLIHKRLKRYKISLEELRLVGLYKIIQGL